MIERMEQCYIFPHEFLYLICNTQDRLEVINKCYKVDFKSQKGVVYDWEISDKNKTDALVTHIHLLSQNAFKNQAPQHLITEHLAKISEEHPFTF